MYTLTVEVGVEDDGAEVSTEVKDLSDLCDILFGDGDGRTEGLQWNKVTKVTIVPQSVCAKVTDAFAPDWCVTHGQPISKCLVESLRALPHVNRGLRK